MRVVFLTTRYFPHIGGVEKHIAGLCATMREHQITIITEQYQNNLSTHESIGEVEVFRIPVSGLIERDKKWIIWKWIRKHDSLFSLADIIHVHDVFYWLYWYRLAHPYKKIFTTFHGWEGVYPIPLKNILHKNLAQLLSNGTIGVGDYISKWYGITPDFVTYGATDLVRDLPLESRGRSQRELLFLGRLDQDTGFDACVKKYYLLKHILNWKLIIAGDGPLKNLIPPEASHLGFVANPSPYISQSDYVFTTGYMGILESLIQKKVVLSSYNNPVKKDYLLMHPMSKYLVFDNQIPSVFPQEAYHWAADQTWKKLSELYLKLWSK